MSAAVAAAIAIVVFVALVTGVYVVSRNRTRHLAIGEPDRVSSDLVSGLMVELRKWQAESAYWKSTAERLQRELDNR